MADLIAELRDYSLYTGYSPSARRLMRSAADALEAKDAVIAKLNHECQETMREIAAIRSELATARQRAEDLEKVLRETHRRNGYLLDEMQGRLTGHAAAKFASIVTTQLMISDAIEATAIRAAIKENG